MIRATTPTHTFNIPFASEIISDILVTYKQGEKIVLEKRKADLTNSGTEWSYRLTQSETASFTAGEAVLIQIRVTTLGGEAVASDIYKLAVNQVLNDEVLV